MIELKKIINIESLDYYPLLYIPNRIKEMVLDNKFYVVEDKQIEEKYKLNSSHINLYTNKPKLPEQPRKFKNRECEETITKQGFGTTLVLFMMFIIVFLLTLTWKYFLMSVFFFVFIVIIFFILKSKVYTYSYTKQVELSEEEIKKNQEKYDNEMREYNKDMRQYKEAVNNYNQRMNEYKEYTIKPRKMSYIYDKYLQGIQSKLTYQRENYDKIKKGKVENNFLEYLSKKFGFGEIKIDISVPTYNSAFYPDYLFYSEKYNFCIDIEIDERYDYESKKPIHFIGSDEQRNNYFLDKNCFVLRFSEEQISKEPEKCCDYIQDVINVISSPQTYEIKTKIQRIKAWTYEEAYLQGLSNQRNNY